MKSIEISRLKEAMLSNRINQRELSDLTGITGGAISAYLNGKYTPKLPQLEKIAEVLSVSSAWLLGEDVPMKVEEGSLNMKVPFLEQKISAGFLQEFLSSDAVFPPTRTLSVARKMVALYPPDSLIAAEVDGDSMVDAGISDGDYVIFSKGTVRGDGIYVLSLDGVIMVKRLRFNPIEKSVDIISENKAYPPFSISSSRDGFYILGKVAGCIHAF